MKLLVNAYLGLDRDGLGDLRVCVWNGVVEHEFF
jgi:hypothetical protein